MQRSLTHFRDQLGTVIACLCFPTNWTFLACKLITTLTGNSQKEVKAMLHSSDLTHSRGQAGTVVDFLCFSTEEISMACKPMA